MSDPLQKHGRHAGSGSTSRGGSDGCTQTTNAGRSVGVYDHEQGRSLVALVDESGVVGVHETPATFQLSERERKAAEKLAADDKRVKSFLRRRRMNPLTRLYFPPGEAEQHRHAIVFVRPTTSERRYAIVDLTDERVVDVLGEADLTSGAGS